ncbi:DUF3017 domain-containing protein [Xylanimonas ulmi]|uniref:DUF3017 family protein n=1 Tax=Xylanimonas ulmi TaxID=228973 RepID=A0A4Q7M805_9MICO|nr:DUF3017 domain-containing protein [Xylanibacterium ulmi]RZS63247.1 DUF3017 family protein [Xylanibacterium ulmi]
MESRPLLPGPDAPGTPAPPRRGPNPARSLVLAMTGVVTAGLLGALVSAQLGALTVAATLAVAGVWRAVAPRTVSAAGIAVRSKALDVLLYLGAAVAIAVLALTVPYLG